MNYKKFSGASDIFLLRQLFDNSHRWVEPLAAQRAARLPLRIGVQAKAAQISAAPLAMPRTARTAPTPPPNGHEYDAEPAHHRVQQDLGVPHD
jgi:hypothetical protein